MSKQTLDLNEGLYQYLEHLSLREPDVLFGLREETARLGSISRMQISPVQGQFLGMLTQLIGAQNVLEVGTFTGYSTLCFARALPDAGRVVACDVSDEWTSIGQKYWKEAGVASKIDLRIAPAWQTLRQLLEDGQANAFDLMFIDADKTGYDSYYELGLQLVRPGGLILIDNVLWGGSVIDDTDHSEDTQAIRQLNQKLLNDDRITLSMLPLADGLTLARKSG